MDVLSQDLSLGFWNFFNKDPRHWVPARVGVSISIASTITNPESHAHLAFVDVVAVPLNVADAMGISTIILIHVHNTVNWKRTWTFSTVESEIPAFATTCAIADSKNASPVNMEGCARGVFEEHTVLWEKDDKNKQEKPLFW